MRQFQLIPGKLYSFQNIVHSNNKPVIGTFISGPDLRYGGVLIGKSKVLVKHKIIEADLSLYTIKELK